MNRISIAVATICLVTSHLMAQSADVRGGNRNAYESRPVVDQTISSGPNLGVWQHLDGSVCFPPPYYDNCIYNLNSYSLDLYRLWILHTYWNGLAESDPPQPTYTSQSPEPPPPPPPPVTPVVHEYDWPKEVNTSATWPFSIVTNSGLYISPRWFGCKKATFISTRSMETCARYRSPPFRGPSRKPRMRRRT